MATASNGNGSALSNSITPETVIAKDAGSLFENVNAAQTAADSATVKDELRQSQSFGNGKERRTN